MPDSKMATKRLFDLLSWYEAEDGQALHPINKAIPYGFALCLFLVNKHPAYATALARQVEDAFDPETVVTLMQVADALVEVGDGEQGREEAFTQKGWAVGGTTWHYFYEDTAVCDPTIDRRFPDDVLMADPNPHGYICRICRRKADTERAER